MNHQTEMMTEDELGTTTEQPLQNKSTLGHFHWLSLLTMDWTLLFWKLRVAAYYNLKAKSLRIPHHHYIIILFNILLCWVIVIISNRQINKRRNRIAVHSRAQHLCKDLQKPALCQILLFIWLKKKKHITAARFLNLAEKSLQERVDAVLKVSIVMWFKLLAIASFKWCMHA